MTTKIRISSTKLIVRGHSASHPNYGYLYMYMYIYIYIRNHIPSASPLVYMLRGSVFGFPLSFYSGFANRLQSGPPEDYTH